MLRIIITGGTFDKKYDPIQGHLTFSDTHLPAIMEQARLAVPYELEINQLIDSLDMGDESRIRILESCRKAPERHLVITHGTDTMDKTAQVLGEAGIPKTIVLTGAMVPYSISGSDALFNLGAAVMACQILAPGVYISMNGRVFPWDNVRKNRQKGVFETLDPPGA